LREQNQTKNGWHFFEKKYERSRNDA